MEVCLAAVRGRGGVGGHVFVAAAAGGVDKGAAVTGAGRRRGVCECVRGGGRARGLCRGRGLPRSGGRVGRRRRRGAGVGRGRRRAANGRTRPRRRGLLVRRGKRPPGVGDDRPRRGGARGGMKLRREAAAATRLVAPAALRHPARTSERVKRSTQRRGAGLGCSSRGRRRTRPSRRRARRTGEAGVKCPSSKADNWAWRRMW